MFAACGYFPVIEKNDGGAKNPIQGWGWLIVTDNEKEHEGNIHQSQDFFVRKIFIRNKHSNVNHVKKCFNQFLMNMFSN